MPSYQLNNSPLSEGAAYERLKAMVKKVMLKKKLKAMVKQLEDHRRVDVVVE